MAKVKIMETILRDAHQSQAATRMTIEEMLPVCDKLDKAGYYALEAWGGATFDSCLRYLNEDPCGNCEKRCRTPSCKCCCAGKICWDTNTMPTTWWINSAKCR